MIRSIHGLYHYHKKDTINPDTASKFVDRMIYFIICFGILMTLPQIKTVWVDHNASGVSVLTWASYEVASAFWLAYGIIHRQKPIIFSSIAWLFVQGLIVAGAIIY